MSQHVDFIILGAGIVGLTIAREIKLRNFHAKVLLVEKELLPGLHSSGRNSGVLHSGIYYSPDSLKAKICRQGSIEMSDYHELNGLKINRIGKILVTTHEKDEPQLSLLESRARLNGVEAVLIDKEILKEMEPEARSASGRALFVPVTSVGSPGDLLRVILNELRSLSVEIKYGLQLKSVEPDHKVVSFSNFESISYGHLINATGLHADSVAHLFGVGERYHLLPFKGIYWKLDPNSGIKINHLIYPVPDLNVPFLGVHTTTTTDGITYLGPTAVPAFGRENYKGIEGVNAKDFLNFSEMLVRQFITGNDGFRRLAWQEGRRYFKPWFIDAARAILPRLKNEHLIKSDKVGIRAQMLDKVTGKLVTDFVVESGPHSTHILNSISPAWTCSFPFARYIYDNFLERAN